MKTPTRNAKLTVSQQRELDRHVIEAIVARNWVRERLGRVCPAIDDVVARQEGREVTAADWAEWHAAVKADAKSLKEFVRVRPTTDYGRRVLIEY